MSNGALLGEGLWSRPGKAACGRLLQGRVVGLVRRLGITRLSTVGVRVWHMA